jgi:hypothetical protein
VIALRRAVFAKPMARIDVNHGGACAFCYFAQSPLEDPGFARHIDRALDLLAPRDPLTRAGQGYGAYDA